MPPHAGGPTPPWALTWASTYTGYLIAALGVGLAGGSFIIGVAYVSRWYEAGRQGTALGIYNTLQSIGLFLGGALGGWLAQHMGPGSVSLLCAGLALAWLVLAAGMTPPPQRRTA